MEMLAALEGSALALALRGSTWAYPLVNASHILGIALLVGSIVPLDLRLLGLWRQTPLAALARVLLPMAGIGLALAAVSGGLLFAVKATAYAGSTLFLAKMGLLALGLVNAAGQFMRERRGGGTGPAARLSAAASLAGWVGVLTLGRLVGYF